MAEAGNERLQRTTMKHALASLFLWCASTLAAFAHEVRPAYLELRETASEIYDVLWKVPARGENLRLALYVRLPADARNVSEPRALFTDAAYVERWRIQRPGGLAGQDVTIEGLPATKVDALIRVTDLEGVTQTMRATPDLPTVTIAATASRWQVAGTYLVLGIEHILLGHRSSAVRPRACAAGERLETVSRHDHRVHSCAQHHTRRARHWASCMCPGRRLRLASR